MKVRCILSEALRNITCGTSRAFAWFLAVMAVGALLGGYEAMTVVAQERTASRGVARVSNGFVGVSRRRVSERLAPPSDACRRAARDVIAEYALMPGISTISVQLSIY